MIFYNWVSFLMFLMLKLPYRTTRVPASPSLDPGARDGQERRAKGMSDAGPRQMPEASNSR